MKKFAAALAAGALLVSVPAEIAGTRNSDSRSQRDALQVKAVSSGATPQPR